MERGLLTRADLEHALGRTSGQEVLSEQRFIPSGWAGTRRSTLREARRQNLKLLESLTYGAPLVEVFTYQADVDRLRGALKAALTGRQAPPEAKPARGALPGERVERLAEGRPEDGVPDALAEAAERARARFEAEGDPASVDRAMDEGLLAWQKAASRRWRCSFLTGYFTLLADLANVRSVFRAEAAGWPPDKAASLFIGGGAVDEGDLARAAEEGPGAWKELLSGTPVETFVEFAGSPEEAELEAERVRLGYLRSTREALEGIEPLVAFYLARERDITTLAALSAGLDTGMLAEAIRLRAGPIWWEC